MSRAYKISVLIGLIVLIGGTVAIVNQRRQKDDPVSKADRVSHTGKLVSVDIQGMSSDMPGIYVVRANDQELTVHLDAGESACDREAIKRPVLKVGDPVSFAGDKDDDGVIRVCEQGTYIR